MVLTSEVETGGSYIYPPFASIRRSQYLGQILHVGYIWILFELRRVEDEEVM